MDTRLLRMAERGVLRGDKTRIFRGLGQMQPVLIGFEHGYLKLRIEGVSGGKPCWWRFNLQDPEQKARAKAHFAHLETCKREGTSSTAREAWEV